MKDESLTKLMQMLGSTPAPHHRAGWFVASCPLAPWRHEGGSDHNPAFAIKRETGDAFCNCFACGFHGTLSELIIEMRHLNRVSPKIQAPWGEAFAYVEQAEDDTLLNLDSPDIEETLEAHANKNHEFPQWWLDSFATWREIEWAVDYLHSRHVSPEIADFMDIRVDIIEKRICFPVKNFQGKLMGLHGRAVEKTVEPRYRMYKQAGFINPHIWLGENWIDTDKPILIVEGPFDLTSVLRVYPNSCSPLFANPSAEKIRRMADALEWITLFDNGKGGDAGRTKISQILNKTHIIHHARLDPYLKDPGDASIDQIRAALIDALALK